MSLSQIDLHFLQMASSQSEQHAESVVSRSAEGGLTRKGRGAVIAEKDKFKSAGVSTHLGGILYKPDTDERYVATVNAELVAIGKALAIGHANFAVSTIYVSDCPNWFTFKMLVTLGFKRIVHYGPVLNDRIAHYSKELSIEMISVA